VRGRGRLERETDREDNMFFYSCGSVGANGEDRLEGRRCRRKGRDGEGEQIREVGKKGKGVSGDSNRGGTRKRHARGGRTVYLFSTGLDPFPELFDKESEGACEASQCAEVMLYETATVWRAAFEGRGQRPSGGGWTTVGEVVRAAAVGAKSGVAAALLLSVAERSARSGRGLLVA
jgi:hypothetical protein